MSDAFFHHSLREEVSEQTMHQWLGVIADERYLALSVPQVAAVFRNDVSNQISSAKVIDVVVHAGAPIFIARLSSLLGVIRERGEQETHLGQWVIVLALPVDHQLGFRADQVLGPFHAMARDGQVLYEGRHWKVIDAKRVDHA